MDGGPGENTLVVPLDDGELAAGYTGDTLFVDRPGSERLEAPLPPAEGPTDLRIVLDRGVVEVFGRGGAAALTAVFESSHRFGDLCLRTDSPGHLVVANAWPLPPAVER
jgi:sucrose-6-phosphate hydrolase SacC (GH32 family)